LREAGKRRVAGAEIVNRKIAFELSQSVGKFFWRPILRDHDGCRVNRQRLPLKLLFIGLPNSRQIIETSRAGSRISRAACELRLVPGREGGAARPRASRKGERGLTRPRALLR
jgi:hypothetical protein